MPADFDNVQLTEEEARYALWDARYEKYYKLKESEAREKTLKEMQDAVIPFTVHDLKDYVLKNNPAFKVDDQSRKIFNLLALYFTNSPEFETQPEFESKGYSLKKGILLTGPVGVGKTELLRVFRKNKRQCFHLISVYEIEAACQEKGVEYFQSYIRHVPGWGGSEKVFFQNKIGWAFDDLGRESIVFDFGNKSDVISKIIQTRYLLKDEVPFSGLHVTTNLTPAEIEDRYDYAVRSRLREMFNYITIEGKDRR